MSRRNDIADAVVSLLSSFGAIRDDYATYQRDKMTGADVRVQSSGLTAIASSGSADQWQDRELVVVMIARPILSGESEQTAVGAGNDLAESVIDTLRKTPQVEANGFDFDLMEVAQTEPFDADELRENRFVKIGVGFTYLVIHDYN